MITNDTHLFDMGKKALELTGQVFGRLLVIERGGSTAAKKIKWICLCNPELGGCGKTVEVIGSGLKSGHYISCGCYHRESCIARSTKHGYALQGSKRNTYTTWCAMIQRCTNSNNPNWENYGGRGIKICTRWLKFENFLEDMGEKPKNKTLNRIDNNGNYDPSNCEWSTCKEQNRNRRSNHLISLNGVTKTIVEWAEEIGFPYSTLNARLQRGMSDEEAITTPLRKKVSDGFKKAVYLSYQDGTPVKDICRNFGITRSTMYRYLRENGISFMAVKLR